MNNNCRECRKVDEKLFLKGERCVGPKCALTRRNAPGRTTSQNVRRKKKSEYGQQLLEKQIAKSEYGLRERQFVRIYKNASSIKGSTGSTMLQTLERRLDNIVYRIGWANSRAFARQLVTHGHIKVNGKQLNIPSYEVRVKDFIEPNNKELITKISNPKTTIPSWIKYHLKTYKAEINNLPTRDEIDSPIDEQLIVEYYTR